MISVTLNADEIQMACFIAAKRHTEAIVKGLRDKHGFNGDGFSIHAEGVFGEIVFAKAVNRFWAGSINTFKNGGDVGLIQVRTRSKSDYDLIVRDDDRDTDYFVLVRGSIPSYQVIGYILGRNAKKDCFRKSYGGRAPAFFVPESSLTPINPKTSS